MKVGQSISFPKKSSRPLQDISRAKLDCVGVACETCHVSLIYLGSTRFQWLDKAESITQYLPLAVLPLYSYMSAPERFDLVFITNWGHDRDTTTSLALAGVYRLGIQHSCLYKDHLTPLYADEDEITSTGMP